MLLTIFHASQKVFSSVRILTGYLGVAGNPLPIRMLLLLREMSEMSRQAVRRLHGSENKEIKETLRILYRDDVEIEEMMTMLFRTIPATIPPLFTNEILVNYVRIQQLLIQIVPFVVEGFGEHEAFLIITPKYGSLSNICKKVASKHP